MRTESKQTRERPSVGWTEEVWRGVSLAAAWALGAWSVALVLRGRGTSWTWIGAAWVGLGAACAAAGLLRPLLLDLFAQFHYREKFALFLAHLVVLIAPMGIIRGGWFTTGLVLISISLAAQLVNAVNVHRYLALCGLMAVMGLWRRPDGAVVWAVGWCALAGAVLLTERIRYLLEDVRGAAPAVSPGAALRMALLAIGAPLALAGAVAWLAPAPPPAARGSAIRLDGALPSAEAMRRDAQNVERLMWQALGLAASISVLVAVLYWYAARQNRKKGKSPEIVDVLAKAESEAVGPPPPAAALDPLEGKDPRLEVFRQFRRLERALEPLDLARRRSWTVREYLRRVPRPGRTEEAGGMGGEQGAGDLGDVGEVEGVKGTEWSGVEPLAQTDAPGFPESDLAHTYEKARYGEETPSPEEVDRFRAGVGRVIERARETAPKRSTPQGKRGFGGG